MGRNRIRLHLGQADRALLSKTGKSVATRAQRGIVADIVDVGHFSPFERVLDLMHERCNNPAGQNNQKQECLG